MLEGWRLEVGGWELRGGGGGAGTLGGWVLRLRLRGTAAHSSSVPYSYCTLPTLARPACPPGRSTPVPLRFLVPARIIIIIIINIIRRRIGPSRDMSLSALQSPFYLYLSRSSLLG